MSDSTGIPRKNEGKLRVDLVPPALIEAAARALDHGADKYRDGDEFNFIAAYTFRTVYASLMRHLLAWYSGEGLDAESGLSHLDHAASNLSMLLHYEKTGSSQDDRPFCRSGET
tara:strand:- start:319 stop:660 length:342 start_codon:yes stop_codon:yes gene_type:complete